MIQLTEEAKERLKEMVLPAESVRVAVRGGGCSGMTYNMSFDNKQGEFDKVYDSNGIKVYCFILLKLSYLVMQLIEQLWLVCLKISLVLNNFGKVNRTAFQLAYYPCLELL